MRAGLNSDIRFSAPAERNRQVILDVLADALPDKGTVLELASGTGQHVVDLLMEFGKRIKYHGLHARFFCSDLPFCIVHVARLVSASLQRSQIVMRRMHGTQ